MECAPLENHKVKLVKLLAYSYAKTRLNQLAKVVTADNVQDYVRKQLTKTVLFKHQ